MDKKEEINKKEDEYIYLNGRTFKLDELSVMDRIIMRLEIEQESNKMQALQNYEKKEYFKGKSDAFKEAREFVKRIFLYQPRIETDKERR